MASIWHNDEDAGYDKAKKDVGFTRWRVLVMERTAQLTGLGEDDAVSRINARGLHDFGLDYDKGVTAEEMAAILVR